MSTNSAKSRLLALLVVATGCASGPAGSPECPLLELPAGIDDWWVTVSPGGRHAAAYAERQGFNAFLVAGGRRVGPYP